MNVARILLIVLILSLLVLAPASQPAAAEPLNQESVNRQQPQPTADLASLLQPDGTLDIPAGLEGSFEADGWQMALDKEGQPHFFQAQEPSPNANPEDTFWSSDFLLGVEHTSVEAGSAVYALAVSGNLVYVGGEFSQVGSVKASYIACWNIDTFEWSALGSGTYGSVRAIAVYGDYVYVGGSFTYAGGIPTGPLARWDVIGQSWSALGTLSYNPLLPRVNAIAVAPNGDLYVGGRFYTVNGILVNHIAYRDVSGWHGLAGGVTAEVQADAEVFAIAFGPGGLYGGGRFTSAGGYSAINLALWDGVSWHSVGGGIGVVGDYVSAITVEQGMFANDIYVGGSFSVAHNSPVDHVSVNNVAQWDGSHWSNMGGGVTDVSYVTVSALANHSNTICAGGSFDHAGAVAANNVACWTGASWINLREAYDLVQGVDHTVFALADHSEFLFLGGTFHKAGSYAANHITAFRYLTEKWNGLGSSVNRTVNAVAISGGDVYVGGYFTSAAGLHVASSYQVYLARWHIDSNRWYVVGTGNLISGCTGMLCTPTVNTIFISGDDVYIGGNFTHIGGLAVNGIARFRSTGPDYGWHALGSGVDCVTNISCSVRDIALFNGNLYIGGRFDIAGGTTVNNVAYWDGSKWNALDDSTYNGTNNTVYALNPVINIFSGDYLLVGGSFTSPSPALGHPYLAGWNGSNWISKGTALNGPVYSIIGGVYSPFYVLPIYIGGDFSVPNHIGQLPGSSWVDVGAGLDDTVRTLAFDGKGGLYAGGDFNYSSLDTLFNIGHWNGTAWEPVGSGMNGTVNSLAVSGAHVVAGGDFTKAGGKLSFFVAAWNKQNLFLPIIRK